MKGQELALSTHRTIFCRELQRAGLYDRLLQNPCLFFTHNSLPVSFDTVIFGSFVIKPESYNSTYSETLALE
jgi:hypothetical protein